MNTNKIPEIYEPLADKSFSLLDLVNGDKKEIILGRERVCDVQLGDYTNGESSLTENNSRKLNTVSRKHASISMINSSYFIKDLKSSNGTFLTNDITLKKTTRRCELLSGDKIFLGEYPLIINY